MTWRDICGMVAAGISGILSVAFGGWNAALTTLCIAMLIDLVSGLAVAIIWHKSPKTADGGVESKAGWKGLARKLLTLLLVILCFRLGGETVRDMAAASFTFFEAMSIVENVGLMGVPLPKILLNTLSVLKREAGEDEDNEGNLQGH